MNAGKSSLLWQRHAKMESLLPKRAKSNMKEWGDKNRLMCFVLVLWQNIEIFFLIRGYFEFPMKVSNIFLGYGWAIWLNLISQY